MAPMARLISGENGTFPCLSFMHLFSAYRITTAGSIRNRHIWYGVVGVVTYVYGVSPSYSVSRLFCTVLAYF